MRGGAHATFNWIENTALSGKSYNTSIEKFMSRHLGHALPGDQMLSTGDGMYHSTCRASHEGMVNFLGEMSHSVPNGPPLWSWLFHLRHHRLRLGQPERHVHRLVHRDRCRQRGAGLLLLADRGIQRAQAAVAVGLERAHTELVGQGKSLTIIGFSWRGIWRIAPHR